MREQQEGTEKENEEEREWHEGLGFHWKEGAWEQVSLSFPCHSPFQSPTQDLFAETAPRLTGVLFCAPG